MHKDFHQVPKALNRWHPASCAFVPSWCTLWLYMRLNNLKQGIVLIDIKPEIYFLQNSVHLNPILYVFWVIIYVLMINALKRRNGES